MNATKPNKVPKKPGACNRNYIPQGARTPDGPAQPATKPGAPRARPPSGTRHIEPDSSVERKKQGG